MTEKPDFMRDPTAQHAVAQSPTQTVADEAERFFADAKRAVESGASALNRQVQQNPTLALAGLVAVGALAAVAVRQYRAQPQSQLGALQSEVLRNTRAMRRAIRQELASSGVTSKVDQLGQSLASIDWKPYIQPFVEKAVLAADAAKERVSAVTKS